MSPRAVSISQSPGLLVLVPRACVSSASFLRADSRPEKPGSNVEPDYESTPANAQTARRLRTACAGRSRGKSLEQTPPRYFLGEEDEGRAHKSTVVEWNSASYERRLLAKGLTLLGKCRSGPWRNS